MNSSRRELLMQRWHVIQHDLLPELRQESGGLTPKLSQLVYVLEWVRIEQFTQSSWIGIGRPPLERAWLANAFVAKTVLGLGTTVGLIERYGASAAFLSIGNCPARRRFPVPSKNLRKPAWPNGCMKH